MSNHQQLREVKVLVPEDTIAVLPVKNKFDKWAIEHKYLLATLSGFFFITWIVEVVVNVIWK